MSSHLNGRRIGGRIRQKALPRPTGISRYKPVFPDSFGGGAQQDGDGEMGDTWDPTRPTGCLFYTGQTSGVWMCQGSMMDGSASNCTLGSGGSSWCCGVYPNEGFGSCSKVDTASGCCPWWSFANQGQSCPPCDTYTGNSCLGGGSGIYEDCSGECFNDDDCIDGWGIPCLDGIGDGYCDDGTDNGYLPTLDFTCAQFDYDGGDCDTLGPDDPDCDNICGDGSCCYCPENNCSIAIYCASLAWIGAMGYSCQSDSLCEEAAGCN